MSLQSTTDSEKEIVLFALRNEIFSGIDGMSNLVASSYGIASFLKKKIEITSKLAYFATALAQVVVKSLCKAASKLDVSNYRPISFHLTWSKVFEKAIFIRLYNFLERNSIIYVNFLYFAQNHLLQLKIRSDIKFYLLLNSGSTC